MDIQKIKYTVAFQLVCLSIILWVLAASGTPTEAKRLQQATTPEPFLGPIYYGREDVSKIFDHEYPFFGGEGADNDVEPADSVMHYDGVRYNAPIPSRYGYDSHIGIDYTLLYEPVLAAADGTVLFAGWSDPTNHRLGYGLYVRMSHVDNSSYRAWYGHLSTLTVETGETVTIDPMDPGNRNRIIGISGNTGNVFNASGTCGDVNLDPLCGAHLHFEIRQISGNKPVNPYGWVAPVGTPDPWAVYEDPPATPAGATSYDLWETYPALTPAADQYPGAGTTGLVEPSVLNPRVVMDDSSPDFTTTGSCWTAEIGNDGVNGDYHWTTANPGGICLARWIFPIDSFTPAGEYDVFVHLTDDATSLGTAYDIFHSTGVNDSVAVQGAYPNEAHGPWAYLGRYAFAMDGTERIVVYGQTLADDAGNRVVADAVRLAPAVALNSTGSIYISPNTSGTTIIDSLAYADEDILRYIIGSDTWVMFFDGSVAGVTANVNAFHILEASDDILMSFDTPTTIPGIGAVDDSDIVRYSITTNSFQMYLDGSTVGLTTDNADIDSIAFAPDGRLIISTVGRIGTVPNQYEDEDLVIFNMAQTSFSLYFDGSDVSLTATGENITGVWVDDLSGDIYLNTTGNFSVLNASGEGSDLFICEPNSVGNTTSCDFSSGLYWNGSGHGLTEDLIDGLYITQESTQSLVTTATVDQSSDDAGPYAAPIPDPPGACSATNYLYATDHNEIYFGFCPDDTEIISGFRFTDIDVPQGAIIQEARIEFTTDGPFTNTLSVQFRGELTTNSSTFSPAIRPDNRPLTVAIVPWNVPSTSSWAVWDNTESPNLSSIIQEIVDQSGWSTGNALTIVVEPQPSATPDEDRRVIAWDRENNSNHTAELTIWYTVP